MNKKIAVRVITFTLIFISVISVISVPLIKLDSLGNEVISSFYGEEKQSLDAVYIGSSNCFTFWNSLLAWKNYGIAVHPYATDANTILSTEYLIREARKTQPYALYIVNINTTDEKYSSMASRNVLDCMPFSVNKLNFINQVCSINSTSFDDSLEFFFPLIRFHSRWNKIKIKDFFPEVNDYNGSTVYTKYLKNQVDVSASFAPTDNVAELSDVMTDTLESLLDYCDEQNVNVLFVTVPQAKGEKDISKFNAINAFISSRGYTVLDLTEKTEDLGLSYKTDYYNEKHTNIHGSVKFTEYFAEYLIENYGFSDKREDDNYSSWDERLEAYSEKISPYLLDFEINSEDRNYQLSCPELKIHKKSGEAEICWSAVDGADGYSVYCKSGTSGWEKIKNTHETEFTVSLPEKGSVTYTVVPYTVENGSYSYGNFSYVGAVVSADR